MTLFHFEFTTINFGGFIVSTWRRLLFRASSTSMTLVNFTPAPSEASITSSLTAGRVMCVVCVKKECVFYVLLVDSIRILSILAALLNFITNSCGKSPVVLQNVLSSLVVFFSWFDECVFWRCVKRRRTVHSVWGMWAVKWCCTYDGGTFQCLLWHLLFFGFEMFLWSIRTWSWKTDDTMSRRLESEVLFDFFEIQFLNSFFFKF